MINAHSYTSCSKSSSNMQYPLPLSIFYINFFLNNKIMYIQLVVLFIIWRSVNVEQGQYQMGKSKIFIKAPESVSDLI